MKRPSGLSFSGSVTSPPPSSPPPSTTSTSSSSPPSPHSSSSSSSSTSPTMTNPSANTSTTGSKSHTSSGTHHHHTRSRSPSPSLLPSTTHSPSPSTSPSSSHSSSSSLSHSISPTLYSSSSASSSTSTPTPTSTPTSPITSSTTATTTSPNSSRSNLTTSTRGGVSGPRISSSVASGSTPTAMEEILGKGRKGSVAAMLRKSHSITETRPPPPLMSDMNLQMRWQRKMVPVMGEVKVDSNNRRYITITAPTSPYSDQRPKFFRLPGSSSSVRLWGSVTLYGSMISECHKGQVTHTFLTCKMAADAAVTKSFSVVLRDGAIHDFVAASSELRDKWVEAFEYIRANSFQVDNFHKELLQNAWLSLTSNKPDALVTMQQVKGLLKTLDVRVTKALLQTLYNDLAGNKPGLNCTKFNILLYELFRRDEVVNLFERISPGESISELSFMSFLRDDQSEKGITLKDVREIIATYGDEGSLQLDGFEQYLTSSENSIFYPSFNQLYQDMDAPLSQYFINSSSVHSSLESYSSALSKGCVKLFQVSLVEGKDKNPVTRFCLFEQFVTLLRDQAFRTTPWPVIIYLSLHGCTEEQQVLAATILEEKLGTLLAKRPSPLFVLPTPASLQNKIVLMGHPHKSHSDLQRLFYFHSHSLDEMPENMRPWDVLVVKEKQLDRIDFSGLDQRNFTNITAILPSKSITERDPMLWMTHGVQIIPFFPNRNTPDHWANDGFFMQNGYCGYVRKPWFLTMDPCAFENTLPANTNPNVYTQVHMMVSSARGLSKISDPLEIVLEIKILGPDATKLQRYKPQKGGTFNPQWDQVFEAPLQNSALDVLVFSLGVRNITGSVAQLAHYALPINCMHTGYRVVKMVAHDDDQPTMSTLFVWVDLTSKVDVKFPLHQHLDSLPEIPLVHTAKSAIIGHFSSAQPELQCSLPSFCGHVISTYPESTTPGKKVGDPICDQYSVSLATDKIIFALADGCNWGEKPKLAAFSAVNNFVEFSTTYCRNVKTVKELGNLLLRALANANRSIFGSHFQDNTYDTLGSTTLLAGVIFRAEENSSPETCMDEVAQLAGSCNANLGHTLSATFLPSQKPVHTGQARMVGLRASGTLSPPAKVTVKKKAPKIPYKWMCMIISVGDCKVFHWSKRLSQILLDFTLNNRGESVRDPGGRIGLHGPDGSPDLRNLTVLCKEVEEGDVFLMCSDGVHDNLDAKNLGKEPADLSATLTGLSWDDAALKHPELLQDLKQRYMADKLTSIINEQCGGIEDAQQVVTGVLQYCLNTTNPIRTWLQDNPNARQPNCSAEFPGKPDHTSLLYIRVGKLFDVDFALQNS